METAALLLIYALLVDFGQMTLKTAYCHFYRGRLVFGFTVGLISSLLVVLLLTVGSATTPNGKTFVAAAIVEAVSWVVILLSEDERRYCAHCRKLIPIKAIKCYACHEVTFNPGIPGIAGVANESSDISIKRTPPVIR